jgi:hypothetical protein
MIPLPCLPRRVLLIALSLAVWPSVGRTAEPLDPAKAKADPDGKLLWYDIRDLGVEGQGWSDVDSPFDRLPKKAKGVVRDAVWGLSRDSAGMAVRFVTDATAIHARWTLRSERLAMPHMAATGVSGLDLYAKTDDGRLRWLAVGQPKLFPTNQAALASGLPAGKREYVVYLPLYNGVTSVEIGIDKQHSLAKADARPATHRQPILFYGTSITHGACASRPGMCHPAILGRRFDRPVINLGFSGNGRMEPEVAKLLAELDPCVYVLDCLPNMQAAEVAERTEPFVKTLRESRPTTPILLVEDRSYADSFLIASKRTRNLDSRAAYRKAFERLTAAGVKHLSYLEGEQLLGDDGDGTVDSSHPNDLGFVRQADAMEKVMRPVLHKLN